MSDLANRWPPSPRGKASTHLEDRADELRASLRLLDPELVAARSGSSHLALGPGRGELHIPLWGDVCVFTWPDLVGHDDKNNELPAFQQALILYYLLTADGTLLASKWVSFADLPDGRMYNAAFQGYSGNEIAKAFGPNLNSFKHACTLAGGDLRQVGDAAYEFDALPRVPALAVYWLGDEDFPSSCKILFDETASHYLPVDACAILGSMLTRKLLAFRK